MRKAILSLIGLATAAMSANANAALLIDISGASGVFANDTVGCSPGPVPCAFFDQATFVTPAPYQLIGLTISSIIAGGNAASNIDFTNVSLNGVNLVVDSAGAVEFRYLQNLLLVPGATNTLSIAGLTGGDAAYAGTLSFGLSGPSNIPEPSTWLMMILGIGYLGAYLRRRRTALLPRSA